MEKINLSVKVHPIVESKTNTKAFASISVNDLIAINSIRVVEGSKGLFVTMPQYKNNEGEYKDIAFPMSKELRQQISSEILAEYEKVKKPSLSENLKQGADKSANQTPQKDIKSSEQELF